jgi:hypothetical protein
LRRSARALALALFVSLSGLVATQAEAQGSAKSGERLPELPAIPSIEMPRPSPADLEELDARLGKLCSSDEAEREAARREALEVDAKLVPALRFRLASTAESTNHDDLKELLLKLRKKGRDDARDEEQTHREDGKHGKVKTPDYLQMAAEHAEPHSKLWCSLVSVLAESRMLTQIGTVEAVRGLIDVYVRYGEFLRVDTQLQLEDLGDRAVPALIEARRHPAEKIAKWSARELDTLGKAIPSETVQTNDLQVLGDVLRAYGRVRDPRASSSRLPTASGRRSARRRAKPSPCLARSAPGNCAIPTKTSSAKSHPATGTGSARRASCSANSIACAPPKYPSSTTQALRHASRATWKPCARRSIRS